MAAAKRLRRAARAIQAECGVKFTTARQWVFENQKEITSMTLKNERPDWSEFSAAAVGLWRRNEKDG